MSEFVKNPTHRSKNFASYSAYCEIKGGSFIPVVIDLTDKDPIPEVGFWGWCQQCVYKCGMVKITEVNMEVLHNHSDPLKPSITITPGAPGDMPFTGENTSFTHQSQQDSM